MQQDKKGVSLMVGYVLLIAIAVALSVAVFFYLKLYLPSDKPQCYTDIDLTIDEVKCVSTAGGNYDIYINISNRGLFSVDSAYIKIGGVDRVYKRNLKDPQLLSNWLEGSQKCNFGNELKPGEKFCGQYAYNQDQNQPLAPGTTQEVSVEPLLYVDNVPVLCSEGVVKKEVMCN